MASTKLSKSFISRDSLHRLLRDVKQIMTNPLTGNGIFYKQNEEDMLKGYAMIIGPEDTPYCSGYYFFELTFPNDYPHSPPLVTFRTNGDEVRFNPNLYKTGKVCVSILNTWRGEQWNSCQTISTLLLTLCTLLCKDPLLNEPGVTRRHTSFAAYNRIIEYKNVEVAMLHLLNKKDGYYLPWFDLFYEPMVEHFVRNRDKIKALVDAIFSEWIDTPKVTLKTSLYNMCISADYHYLRNYFDETFDTIKTIDA